MGCVGRGHSPGRWALLVTAVSGGAVSLAVWVVGCSTSSSSGRSDAGSDDSGGVSTADDAGSDSGSDADAEGGGLGYCISTGGACDAATLCCAGGTCMPGDGGPTCMGGTVECLPSGAPCSSSESCCNGQSNCGEGTTNTCP